MFGVGNILERCRFLKHLAIGIIMIWMRRMRALVYGSSQHRALWLEVGYLSFFSCLTPNENTVKSKLCGKRLVWLMLMMMFFLDNISHNHLFYDHWNVLQGDSRSVSMNSHPWTPFLGGKFNVHSDHAISTGSVHLSSTLCVSCVDQGSALTGFATGGQNKWGKRCNVESRKGSQQWRSQLSILAYKHLRIIFYFASSVLAVAFSSLTAIPFQAILGELRDIFLICGCWSLDFTQSGHFLAKCKYLWPITSS